MVLSEIVFFIFGSKINFRSMDLLARWNFLLKSKSHFNIFEVKNSYWLLTVWFNTKKDLLLKCKKMVLINKIFLDELKWSTQILCWCCCFWSWSRLVLWLAKVLLMIFMIFYKIIYFEQICFSSQQSRSRIYLIKLISTKNYKRTVLLILKDVVSSRYLTFEDFGIHNFYLAFIICVTWMLRKTFLLLD